MNNTVLLNGSQVPAVKSSATRSTKYVAEPDSIMKLNWLIHIYHVRGEMDACKALIDDEIKRSNEMNAYALYKKGLILREEGNLQEALTIFQACYQLNTDNVNTLKEIGKTLFLLKRYRLAHEVFIQAERASQKSDWEIYHNLGEVCFQLKEILLAKEHLQTAIKLGRQEVSYNLLIKILSKEGDWETAVSYCNACIESCPDNAEILAKSGVLYMRIGESQHAFERFSSALALEPTNSNALLGIGCITQNHHEHDVALAKYKIAVQTDVNSIALWNNIGMCFYAKQKYVAAATCLKRALWHSPLNWKVLINLGLINMYTGQCASAFNFICAAINIRPDFAQIFMLLGCTLLELEDSENALRALMQAQAMSPDDSYVMLNTCLGLLIAGYRDNALEVIERYKTMEKAHKHEELNSLFAKLDLTLSMQNEELDAPPNKTANGNDDTNQHDKDQGELV